MTDFREIPLTQGLVALVDTEDIERVIAHLWFANKIGDNWYAVTAVGYDHVLLHRFILNLGPGDSEVDHINNNGLDCRRENLRLATSSQNVANRGKVHMGTSSKYKGVSWYKVGQKWAAYIKVDYKKRHLGLFAVEEDAARAYDNAAREAWGEFANTNF